MKGAKSSFGAGKEDVTGVKCKANRARVHLSKNLGVLEIMDIFSRGLRLSWLNLAPPEVTAQASSGTLHTL
jgi:hypothetical protein